VIDVNLGLIGQEVKMITPKIRLHWDMIRTIVTVSFNLRMSSKGEAYRTGRTQCRLQIMLKLEILQEILAVSQND